MEHYRQHTAMFNGLLDTVRSDIVSNYLCSYKEPSKLTLSQAKGSERPSACASLLKNSNRSGLSNNEIAWTLGTL